MRKESDLVDDSVNVQLRAKKAAARVGTNGRLQSIGHAAQPPMPSWFDRLFPQEHLIVGGREVKGFVIPHWAAGVILAALLSGMGFMYSRIQDQRDLLIEMRTTLNMTKEASAEERRNLKNTLDLQQVYINDLNKQMSALRIILTPQQQRTLNQTTRRTEN